MSHLRLAEVVAQTTSALYQWERRGRGWTVHGAPVRLEPPFLPFEPPTARLDAGLVTADDGRKPTGRSRIFNRLLGRRPQPHPPPLEPRDPEDDEPEWLSDDTEPLVELRIALPPGAKVARDSATRLLATVGRLTRPLSFEYVATERHIVPLFSCASSDGPRLEQQLRAYVPDAVIERAHDLLEEAWTRGAQDSGPLVVEFGLSHEFMLPLMCSGGFDPDPMLGVLGALSDLGSGETGVFQVLLEPVRGPWRDGIASALTDFGGGHFFLDAPELITGATEKIGAPLFAAIIRIAARSSTTERTWQIVSAAASGLAPLARPGSNELFALSNADYDPHGHVEDLLARRSRRTGMILNLDELVTIVHPPSGSVRIERLTRHAGRTRAAPEALEGEVGLLLGSNRHAGKTVQARVSLDQRLRHTHLLGASGTGKSTLMLSMIEQDLAAGVGVAVLDPHGDLIERILERIPEKRIGDVVVFDPADEDHPVGFNILQAHSSAEKHLLASDLVALFRRFATSWGDQMTSVLANAVLASLESPEGGTLADLRRFLVESEYRRRYLASVDDEEVRYFWERQFPLLSGKPQAPILTRLDAFLRHRLVRQVVSQRESKLDLSAILNGQGILLAKLSEGEIGEENAYLLGSLLVSKLHQLALARQRIDPEAREPFFLYIDECHHFVTPSMTALLAGARKYGLGLVLAHQDLAQVRRESSELESALLTNPATRVVFRVSEGDARTLSAGFTHFEADDLQRLGVGEAICRVERSDWDFSLATASPPPRDIAEGRVLRDRVVAFSRERFGGRAEERSSVASDTPPRRERRHPEMPDVQERAESRASASRRPTTPPDPSGLPPPLGQGGPSHVALQNLIKRRAVQRGWRVEIEAPVLDGTGRVDVALTLDDLRVACEVSVSTSSDQELSNVRKCLEAGFDRVFVVSTDRNAQRTIDTLLDQELTAPDRQRARCVVPEELFGLLEELEASGAGASDVVNGYRVRVRYDALDDTAAASRRAAITRVLVEEARRRHGDQGS